jgi:hypothetical protein
VVESGGRVAGEVVDMRRARRVEARLPEWLVPGEPLRSEVLASLLEREIEPGARLDSRLRRSRFLDHPLIALVHENLFAASERTGVRVLAPYLDPDLISFLGSLPPARLVAQGRAKALAAELAGSNVPVYRRQWPKTVYADSIWNAAAREEARDAWTRLEGDSVLGGLGVIDQVKLAEAVGSPVGSASARGAAAVRAVILETWIRARILKPSTKGG